MKMGLFDGSAEEVRDLMENNGLRLEDYLEKPPPPLKTRYIVIPASLFFISLCIIVLVSPYFNEALATMLYLVAFACATWLAVVVQLKFKNAVGTFCVALGSVLLVLLAMGKLSPEETTEIIRGLGN